jgi:Na+/melibiose symporter-like transporter
MYADVLKNISIQSLGSAMSTATMVIILVSAPLLTKKWDLVLIIRTCLLAGVVSYAGLMAYALMSSELIPILFVVWNSLAGALVQMSVQMQWGLVAESIDYNEYLTGKRNEGTIYGFFSLSRRIGTTIANSASVLIIAAIGYDAAAANAGLEQAPGTIMGIKLMVLGFPLIAALGSFSCFTFIWNINKDVRAKMAEWKAAKAAK